MAVIFSASTDAFSAPHTSRWIGPFLLWLWPSLSAGAVADLQFALRKAGHMLEYALLAILLWRALRRAGDEAWSWRAAAWAVSLAAAYAVTDEIHQSFTRLRQGSPWDVLIDVAGAALALLALGWWRRRRQRRD